jgi:hypothetical protein
MKRILLVISALALAALACGPNFNFNVPRLETGPLETFTVSEAAPPKGEAAGVTIRMGAGDLTLTGGADGLASGTIDYNVPAWMPTVTRDDNALTIEQGNLDRNNLGIVEDDITNTWTLKLGNAPMDLTLEAGAYKGELDLSGLALTNLTISDGASDSTVTFDEVNPEAMDTFRYTTGASSVKLNGLANANFENLVFKGGAGDYTLDFSGELQRDATVDITAGVCRLEIVVPEGTAVKIKLSGGLSDVRTEGTWSVNDKTYALSGEGPTLTINVDMGIGSLTLISK